jgi:hypothetical protein
VELKLVNGQLIMDVMSIRIVKYCSGGGSYNEQGVKIGQWTELHENYN